MTIDTTRDTLQDPELGEVELITDEDDAERINNQTTEQIKKSEPHPSQSEDQNSQ